MIVEDDRLAVACSSNVEFDTVAGRYGCLKSGTAILNRAVTVKSAMGKG